MCDVDSLYVSCNVYVCTYAVRQPFQVLDTGLSAPEEGTKGSCGRALAGVEVVRSMTGTWRGSRIVGGSRVAITIQSILMESRSV